MSVALLPPQSLDAFARIPRRGLVAEYKMVDATGVTLPDSSGNARDGTLVGAPTIAAASGVTFNGTTQYVTLPTSCILSNLAGYSILIALSGASQVSKTFYSEGASGDINPFVAWGTSTGGPLQRWRARDASAVFELQSNASLTVFDSTPHILAMNDRFTSGSSSSWRAWADGHTDTILGATDYTRSAKVLNRASLAVLGSTTYAAGTMFAGSIYYVLMWGRALSPGELRAAMRAVRGILKSRNLL